MIKVITFVRRHPSVTRAEFLDHWLNRHAPLVQSVPEFWRHVRGYRQSHGLASAPIFAAEANPDEYDGCAELWFDSVDSMTAAVNEPAYLAIIKPDELKWFADLSKAPVIIAVEHVIAEPASAG